MKTNLFPTVLACVMSLATIQIANAQWTTAGAGANNVRNTNTGNVGIGVTVPTAKLHVNGNAKVNSIEGNSTILPIKSGDIEFTIDKDNSAALTGAFEIFNGTGAHCLNIWENGSSILYNSSILKNQKTDGTSALELQGGGVYGASLALKQTGANGLKWTLNSSPDGTFRIVKVTGNTHSPFVINPNGQVSMGSLNPVAKVESKNYDAGNYGGTVFARALAGVSSASGGVADGVYGEAENANSYAVWGRHNQGAAGGDAGHFNGDLLYSGDLLDFSDAQLKTNIQPLGSTLNQIMALKPATYLHRPEFEQMGLGNGPQIGFIAQEVEKVFPQLVKNKTDHSISLETPLQLKAVNYIGLVPVLVAGIQEQQRQIEAQTAEILAKDARLTALEDRINKIEALLANQENSDPSMSLTAIRPNPASNQTNLDLNIPATAQTAQVAVFDAQGKKVKEMNISERGFATVTLDLGSLANGNYFCTIIIDGQKTATRQLVVVKN